MKGAVEKVYLWGLTGKEEGEVQKEPKYPKKVLKLHKESYKNPTSYLRQQAYITKGR